MRLARITVIALLSMTIVFVIACGSSTTPPPPGFITYTDVNNYFSIAVPEFWVTNHEDADRSDNEQFAWFLPTSQCACSTPVVSVLGEYTHGEDLQTSYQLALDYYSGLWNYYMISEGETTIDGIPAKKVVFTYTETFYTGTISNDCTIQQMRCMLVNNDRVWIIDARCDSSCWSTYESTFNTMVASLQLK